MQRKVSVIIPVIRPDNVSRLEKWIYERAGIPESDIEILALEDRERIGTPKMVKMLAGMARYDLVMYLGDDCEPQPNFLLAALNEMRKFNGNWGLVGLNCGRWIDKEWQSFLDHGEVSQHWLAHKKLLKHLDGEFFHTGYTHCFCDNELTQRCKDIKRYRFSKKSRIIHHHPIVMEDETLWDQDLKRVYSEDVYNADRRLFNLRKANRWQTKKARAKKQVMILVPIHGEGFHLFWTCLSALQFKCLTQGIDTFLLKKSSADIAHCRNLLASESLRKFPNATHFLFMDADMTFPSDLLIKLLEHDKDIVTVSAYRKGMGFYPVVSCQGADDDFFRPVHIKPTEGKLRKVTSAGTGIVLIKREVFEQIEFPWFKSEYINPIGEDADAEPLIEGKLFVSEDNRFYVIATSLGFDLYCDFSIEIGHLGIKKYTWEDHEKYLEELKDGKRNKVDHESADPGDSRDRDRQYN